MVKVWLGVKVSLQCMRSHTKWAIVECLVRQRNGTDFFFRKKTSTSVFLERIANNFLRRCSFFLSHSSIIFFLVNILELMLPYDSDRKGPLLIPIETQTDKTPENLRKMSVRFERNSNRITAESGKETCVLFRMSFFTDTKPRTVMLGMVCVNNLPIALFRNIMLLNLVHIHLSST